MPFNWKHLILYAVNITKSTVLDNPTAFLNAFQFEISYECLVPLKDGYLQELVYKLSKVGQAIENNDFFAAVDVLGPNTGTYWVKNVNVAFAKLSSTPEEKTKVDTFNSSLKSLIFSVGQSDIGSSRVAFISSASALEKWIVMTGLVGRLKGL